MTQWVDTFVGRTVGAGSWGNASDGETWSVKSGSAAGLSVSGGQGLYTTTSQVLIMRLGTTTATDTEALVRWSFVDTANAVHIMLRLTDSTHFYRLGMSGVGQIQLGFKNGGGFTALNTVTNPISGGFLASTLYWWKFRILGTSLFGKVWIDGSPEPMAWGITATDSSIASGGVGVAANTNTSATTITFDSFGAYTYATPASGVNNVVWSRRGGRTRETSPYTR